MLDDAIFETINENEYHKLKLLQKKLNLIS